MSGPSLSSILYNEQSGIVTADETTNYYDSWFSELNPGHECSSVIGIVHVVVRSRYYCLFVCCCLFLLLLDRYNSKLFIKC